jgi:hypothetical protein
MKAMEHSDISESFLAHEPHHVMTDPLRVDTEANDNCATTAHGCAKSVSWT